MIAFLMAVLTIIGVLVVLGMLDNEAAVDSALGKIWSCILGSLAFVVIGGILVAIVGIIIYAFLTIGSLI